MGFWSEFFSRFLRRPGGAFHGRMMSIDGAPVHFDRYDGRLYEAQLARAAIDAIARHVSKLEISIQGSAKPTLQTQLKNEPNPVLTWSQFMYRLATILYVENNAIIVPLEDEKGNVTGIYPLLPKRCEVAVYGNVPYLRYKVAGGTERAAIELERVGIMTRFQYADELHGESNRALAPTMDLIGMQNQGIKSGVENTANYKFMANLTNYTKDEDLAKERKRFTEMNLKKDSDATGILLFPNTFANAKQIEYKPFVADAETVKLINDSVNQYFGVNEKILKNQAVGDEWNAFYEGAIEPFAVQFSEVVTKMLFTPRERAAGASIMATSNRLQYMSNKDKLEVTSQLVDRGIMSRNQALAVWNLPPVAGGDVLVIRGEYVNANERTTKDDEE